jgi:Xaa-Pro aminopeptidase
MIAARVDGLLIGQMVNVRYLTGFTGSAGVLVVTGADATLYVDGRYAEQAQHQSQGATAQTTTRDILGGVLRIVKGKFRRLGFEGHALPYEAWKRISDAVAGTEVTPTSNLVEGLRAKKDAEEVAAIGRAARISDDVYADCLEWIRPGMREREVAGRIEHEHRRRGADRKDTQTAVGSGPRSAMPHCIASDRIIETNEPVMLDIGGLIDGYTSDLTRTIFLGTAVPEEFRRIHDAVDGALRLVIERARPGMTGRQVHEIAHAHLRTAGYGDYFPHALGHSLGLAIHERPQFSAFEDAVIEPGNVITVEPGVYLPGKFGVRTEDLVLVTDQGCELLNGAERALMIR